MENKKLVAVLQRDMNELEELIADMKSRQVYDALEMEFIHTRTKGIIQLIKLLKVDEDSGQDKVLTVNDDKIDQLKEAVSSIKEEVHSKEKVSVNELASVTPIPEEELPAEEPVYAEPVIVSEPERNDGIPKEEEHVVEDAPEPVADEVVEDFSSHKQPNGVEVKEESFTIPDEDDQDMLDNEPEINEMASRLGDSFLKGKSINDLVSDQNKLEFKLSNRPVHSIRSAIGINDRFQYIRELFDGDVEKFNDTVTSLDSMTHIREAVHYLRQNFRWKKTETSLKFVNLVKRRFQ